MLEVFDNDSIHRILRVRRRDSVPYVELRRRLCLTSIPVQFVQRRLRWFGHTARRPEGELIKDLLLSTPPRTWRPAEDASNHYQGKPRAPLRATDYLLRTGYSFRL